MYSPDRIQTARLRLRPFTIKDADAVFGYVSDVEFSKYLNYEAPSCIEEVIDFLQRVLAGEMGANLWAIALKDNPKVIGAVQLDIEDTEAASLHYKVFYLAIDQ